MEEIVIVRDSHLIDPQMAIWGWEIPVYLFLGGLAAGIMILSAVLALRKDAPSPSRWARWAPFLAPVIISLGMFALMLDLSHKPAIYRFYMTFRPLSPMSWGAWILVGIYPATLLLAFANLKPEELTALKGWRPVRALRLWALAAWLADFGRRHHRGLLWANIVLGIGLGIYTGILLGALGVSRPAWSSALLGPLFLVSGFSTGAAAMMLLPLEHREHGLLRRWDMLAIGVELVLLVLLFISLAGAGGAAQSEAAGLFLGGRFTAVFWGLVVVAGLAVPLVIEALESRKGLRPTVMAPVLLLVGGLALRWILVLAGQAA